MEIWVLEIFRTHNLQGFWKYFKKRCRISAIYGFALDSLGGKWTEDLCSSIYRPANWDIISNMFNLYT